VSEAARSNFTRGLGFHRARRKYCLGWAPSPKGILRRAGNAAFSSPAVGNRRLRAIPLPKICCKSPRRAALPPARPRLFQRAALPPARNLRRRHAANTPAWLPTSCRTAHPASATSTAARVRGDREQLGRSQEFLGERCVSIEPWKPRSGFSILQGMLRASLEALWHHRVPLDTTGSHSKLSI